MCGHLPIQVTIVYPKSHIHSFYELYATWLGRHGGTLFFGCDTKSGPLNHASTHEVLYELPHIDILNQRERRRFLERSCRCMGRDGLPLARHGREGHSIKKQEQSQEQW
jgi:hypothetical protein